MENTEKTFLLTGVVLWIDFVGMLWWKQRLVTIRIYRFEEDPFNTDEKLKTIGMDDLCNGFYVPLLEKKFPEVSQFVFDQKVKLKWETNTDSSQRQKKARFVGLDVGEN
ncbi:MAG: hypothetical protein WC059_01750 [Candidatus Paceibacterota bacterium]